MAFLNIVGSWNLIGGWPFPATSVFVLLGADRVLGQHLGSGLMDFPILDLLDPAACYRKLLDLLHPDGLCCPRCGTRDGLNIHRHRAGSPVLDYRCKGCRRVFNLFTNTSWHGTR